MTPQERFWAKVAKTETCWIWNSARSDAGYGIFWLNGRPARAHRVSYEWLVGPIPDGLVTDHLCRNRACVNPAHLEPVTQYVNLHRGESIQAKNARKTACVHGHPFSESNTYRYFGHRRCRECRRIYMAARRARQAVAA